MNKNNGRNRGTGAFGSRLRSVLGLGSVAALVLAGAAIVGVVPAAADTLSYSPAPPDDVNGRSGLGQFRRKRGNQ